MILPNTESPICIPFEGVKVGAINFLTSSYIYKYFFSFFFFFFFIITPRVGSEILKKNVCR